MRHHAGQDFDLVRLLALGGEARLAGPAAVEILLDIGLGERDHGRAAVDHAADRYPMALAEGGDAEHVAESVEGHRCSLGRWIRRVVTRGGPGVKPIATVRMTAEAT